MKMANLVEENFDFEKKTAIKSLHLALNKMENDNKEMISVLNSLAFERKNSKKSKSGGTTASISEEGQKTNDNSSERKLVKDKKRKLGSHQIITNDHDIEKVSKNKSIFGIKSEETMRKASTTSLNTELLNSYNKLGNINKINPANLKRKRSRMFSINSTEQNNWIENEGEYKEDIQNLMLHLFDKNMEANLNEIEMEDIEYENLFYHNKAADRKKSEDKEIIDDVIQKFLNNSQGCV